MKWQKVKKSVTITDSSYFHPFGESQIAEDTELIILEGVTDVDQMNYIINRDKIRVFERNPIDLTFEWTELIITTQRLDKHFIRINENVEIIHCVHHDPWPIPSSTGQLQL